MTPAEAVAHVCEADKCSADAAKKIIQLALDEGKIPAEPADRKPRFLENSYNYYQGLEFPGPEIARRFSGVTITNWDTGTAPRFIDGLAGLLAAAHEARRTEKTPEIPNTEDKEVLLLRAAIESIWTQGDTALDDVEKTHEHPAPGTYRTGLPGKPSSWYLIEAEISRRWTSGTERHATASAWVPIMLGWLKYQHPDSNPPTPKTLKNKIPALLRTLTGLASG